MTDPTEAALLRAVLERPADDLPRLAYADWLDETAGSVRCGGCRGRGRRRLGDLVDPDEDRGCPACGGTGAVSDGRRERAEFIRVQCELARLTGADRADGVTAAPEDRGAPPPDPPGEYP